MFQVVLSSRVIGPIPSIFSSTTSYSVIYPFFFAQRRWRVDCIENMKLETHVLKQENDGMDQIVKNDRYSQSSSKVMEESDDGSFSKVDGQLRSGRICWSIIKLCTTSSNNLLYLIQILFCFF